MGFVFAYKVLKVNVITETVNNTILVGNAQIIA